MGVSNINSIFEELAATPGKNDKLSILKKHKDNDLFKEVCRLALDPFTQFYIRKIPEYTPCPQGKGNPLIGTVQAVRDVIATRTMTGNAAIGFLRAHLGSLGADDAKVIERIIKKDLRCGVETAVNKVWPKLVHEQMCMLVSPYNQKLVDKISWPAYAQLKCDGARFNAVVVGGEARFYGRSGKEFFICDPGFYTQFVKLAAGEDIVFDGELLVRDKFGNELVRKEANGILNKAVKGTQSEAEGKTLFAVLWDIIPHSDWVNRRCDIPYHERVTNLADRCMDQPVGKDRIYLIDTVSVNDVDEVEDLFAHYLEQGKEGLVLKGADTIWEPKRSKSQIKFKAELECDLEIIEWQEGTGKYEGMLGALIGSSSDGVVLAGVGTGFSDDDRAMIGPDIVGCVMSVKYNARIDKRDSNTDSLFLPRFGVIRTDKSKADASKDIE